MALSWAPHTLLAYPVVQRLGLTKARSVAITVGATIVTDTAALMTLEILIESHEGRLSPGFVLKLIPTAGAVVAFIVAGLPWLGRQFFASVGQDRSVRFLFIMAAMLLSAGLAELAGLEPIIGAFLAGLSLNRLVSEGSELSNRIEFFGSAFFIPVFLISVGMLVNLGVVVSDPSILVRAGVFSLVAVGTLLVIAAFIAGKIFGYSGTEIGVVVLLSTARRRHAGRRLRRVERRPDLGDHQVAVLVILVTSLVSSLLATRFLPARSCPRRRSGAGPRPRRCWCRSATPNAPETCCGWPACWPPWTPARSCRCRCSTSEATQAEVTARRNELAEAERLVLGEGAEATSVVRLDLTPVDRHAARLGRAGGHVAARRLEGVSPTATGRHSDNAPMPCWPPALVPVIVYPAGPGGELQARGGRRLRRPDARRRTGHGPGRVDRPPSGRRPTGPNFTSWYHASR